jgi:hypothetical protein
MKCGRWLLAALLCGALLPQSAFGECVRFDERSAVRYADAVFSGTVTNRGRNAAYDPVVAFDVDRVWKGRVTKRFTIRTDGFRFDVGTKYLVFAHKPKEEDRISPSEQDTLGVGQCGSGTRRLSDVTASELKKLGSGRTPR